MIQKRKFKENIKGKTMKNKEEKTNEKQLN